MRFHDQGFFRAAMAAAALTATADGVLHDCEINRALAAVNEHPRLRPFGRAAAEGAFRTYVDQILRRPGGVQTALDALDAVAHDEGSAEAVMRLAAAVCEIDGDATAPEIAMLETLRDRLGLDEDGDPADGA